MRLSEYEALAHRTMQRGRSKTDNLTMASLGLAGESGEVADYIKKVAFHSHDLDEDKVVGELGDILWYIALAARTLGVSLDAVALKNITKLSARYPDGFSSERSRNRD